jgi:hypothetical protein
MKTTCIAHWIVRCDCGIAVRHCGCVATNKTISEEPASCADCRHQPPTLIEEMPSVEPIAEATDDDEIRDL